MTEKLINIFTNETEISLHTQCMLTKKLVDKGYTVTEDYSHNAELIVCIGGDGAFLETVHSCDFPTCPMIGINTGHLGFFQEISPEYLDNFISDYESKQYTIQDLNTVKAEVVTDGGTTNTQVGLNEIVITGRQSYSIHLDISINGMPIERFSGDGILVATSSGSTAYNYSLGGAIVDPRLNALQVTPLAPMNTTAYRSFTSSMLLPAEVSLELIPELDDNMMFIINDGIRAGYSKVRSIKVEVAENAVHLLRFNGYNFWNKVKTKFL